MGIREGLLALLLAEPKHGYQLKLDFEHATGEAWPLNVGQVYSTLQRLERDGLVEYVDTDDEGRNRYRITAAGRAELDEWLISPLPPKIAVRHELSMKVLMALAGGSVEPAIVVARQRTATMQALQDYVRLKADADDQAEFAWVLHLDRLILQAEAELKWLDLTESRLADRPAGTAHHAKTRDAVPTKGD